MSNILFIDDDADVLEINSKYFMREGHIVKTSSKPECILHMINNFKPDCIVLDIMMPRLNGFELCKKIRSSYMVPIIFLSGLTNENDKVKGLMLGGDDYIVKPYSFRELSARIQAQLNRYQRMSNSNLIRYPPLTLDLAHHKAFYLKEEILLSNREYALLLILITNVNQIVTFEAISKYIWGTYSESDRKAIMVIVSRLRKKLEVYKDPVNSIETVWSIGYTFHIKQEYPK